MQDRPLLARQPILDSNKAIYAYELLCRPIPDASEAWQDAHGNSATTEVVIGALHEIGMALLTGSRRFVNFTAGFLALIYRYRPTRWSLNCWNISRRQIRPSTRLPA